MAKNSTKTVESPSVQPEQNESAQATSTTKTFPIPLDGSKGAEFIAESGGVSKAIRILTERGFSRGEVAKMLGKRYQHVRNVLITPVKKSA